MRRLDLHTHLAPPAYWQTLAAQGVAHPLPPWTLDDLCAVLDQYQIAAAVISLPPPGVFFGDTVSARRLARTVNEFLAAVVERAPRRFAALATLPLPDLAGAREELVYALEVLQLDGVALYTHAGGHPLGDPRLEPLYADLDARACYVFVHPTLPPYRPPSTDLPPWVLEFPFETTRAIATLLYQGVFDRYPAIRWHFAHLGGTVPFLAYRLASVVHREPQLAARLASDPVDTLRRHWYDTALSNYRHTLTAAAQLLPIDRIVFGSDWPYAALPEGPDPAPDLAAWEEFRPLIDWQNARALVPRLFERMQW